MASETTHLRVSEVFWQQRKRMYAYAVGRRHLQHADTCEVLSKTAVCCVTLDTHLCLLDLPFGRGLVWRVFKRRLIEEFRRLARSHKQSSHDEQPASHPSNPDGEVPHPPKDNFVRDLDERVDDAPPVSKQLDRGAIAQFLRDAIERVLRNLPERHAAAFLRIRLGGESAADVARDYGVSPDTPPVWANRANAKLEEECTRRVCSAYPADIERALRDMPDGQARAFRMHVREYSWKRIASELGVSDKEAKELYQKAARAVRGEVFPDT